MMTIATAGLGELTQSGSILFIVFLIASYLFIPASIHKTVEQIGIADYFQIPLIVLSMLIITFVFRKKQVGKIKTTIMLFSTYVLTTTITNVIAVMIKIMY